MKTDQSNGQAGTLESGDILVFIDLTVQEKGISIDLDSPSIVSFGKQIISVIRNTLDNLGVHDAYVKAQDRGALDCTISARVETAARRALHSPMEEAGKCL